MMVRQGAIFSVEELERLDMLSPGAVGRWLTEVETQAAHRRSLETMVIGGGLEAQKRGQIGALLLGLIGELGGFMLVYVGKDAIGISAIIGATASLVSVFIYGRRLASQELAAKREALAKRIGTPAGK